MSDSKSHYPDFNVMEQKEHWDPHTREIVEKRTAERREGSYKFFNKEEAETLYSLCSVIVDDSRDSVLIFVLNHFDQKLSSNIGESERKKNVPKGAVLIREGLQALNLYCNQTHGSTFNQLEDKIQTDIVTKLANNSLTLEADNYKIPTKDFFTQILTESVSAYYSHPTIWSEIGYAGPAYPRGYVRSEWGLTDPWEAKRKDA
jgi:hypothetical protein